MYTRQNGLALWLVLTFMLVIAGFTAIAGWLFLQDVDADLAPAQPEAITEVLPAPQSAPAIQTNSASQTPEPGVEEEESPVTQVDLTLKGVIIRLDPGQSRALISRGRQAEQSYLPGDTIQDNVTLDVVDSDHVVLRVNGRRETLYLNRTLSSAQAAGGTTTKSLADDNPQPASFEAFSDPQEDNPTAVTDDEPEDEDEDDDEDENGAESEDDADDDDNV